jgi:hypothetical protein
MAKTTRGREDRFRLLWSLLAWEGELRNHRVQKLLGLESVQASRLIAQFRGEHPDTVEYDTAAHRWLPARGAQIPATALEDYLGLLDEAQDWYEDGRVDFVTPNRRLFALVRHACITRVGLNTRYTSMSHPKGQARVLYPHTLVRLMQRWHLRAWCTQRLAYCDFNLGRMASTRVHPAPASALPPDVDWEQTQELRLGAHRALDADQEQVIRGEYFGGAVARSVRVRRALLPYIINDIRASIDPARQQPPEFQLEVLNAKDLTPWLFSQPPLDSL